MANLLIAYKGHQNAYRRILKKYFRELRIWYETVGETTRIDWIEGTEVIQEIESRLQSDDAILMPFDDYLQLSKKTDRKIKKTYTEGYCILMKAQLARLKELKERGFSHVIYLPLEENQGDSEVYSKLFVYAGDYYIDSYDLFVYKETL